MPDTLTDRQRTVENLVTQELRKTPISIVALVDVLLQYAHDMRASDIHIDPTARDVRVRVRIDGVLYEHFSFSKTVHAQVIARIKVLAGLRSDEHFAMQDGRFRFVHQDASVDVRVSIAPLYHGQNAVLRLLVNHAGNTSLADLGFTENNITKIHKALAKPNGMILATGPTGSGKTTTLYALLALLNNSSVSIVTIEDPIEYAIDGITQIPVHERTHLTFAKGLRSMLRQDPDVIMVGEMRDAETAGIAVSAALTGHLLLSTVHTKDAATTLPRLLDMGVEAYLVASTVSLAIAQRLVRKTCTVCRGETCEACSRTGYRGRVAISEVLVIDERIAEAIVRGASGAEIKKIAKQHGMIDMLEDGLMKVKTGLTTEKEVMRVIHE